MTSYLSVDLAVYGDAPTFWILSDYDTGFAKVVGEQTRLTTSQVAEYTDRLARKFDVEEVLVHAAGFGGALADMLHRFATRTVPPRSYQVININLSAAKKVA